MRSTRTTKRAHPRSRGENWPTIFTYQVCPGSSPLTRGQHLHIQGVTLSTRLIPTHAGKTWVPRGLTSSRRAHPRSHGENFYLPYKMLEYAGSSRLTLGKRCFDRELAPVVRLIPTYGGKTPGTRPRLRSASAHPRTRGKTPRSPHWSSFTLAHPRSHGENGTRGIPYPYKTGSSPLMRGKRLKALPVDRRAGLIPAHAGKTARGRGRRRTRRAHPRSRGENFGSRGIVVDTLGSSPLTRGKPRGRAHRPPSRRLIPAHAGKTSP